MSTKREEYVIIGIDIKDIEDEMGNDDFYDKYNGYFHKEEEGEFVLLSDNYSGKYLLFGEIVRYGDEYEGLPLTELYMSDFSFAMGRVRGKAKELFGIEEQPRVYALTHWS